MEAEKFAKYWTTQAPLPVAVLSGDVRTPHVAFGNFHCTVVREREKEKSRLSVTGTVLTLQSS